MRRRLPHRSADRLPTKGTAAGSHFRLQPPQRADRSHPRDTLYAYAYDNIGNRITAQENAEKITYTTNNLNQYTQIATAGHDFEPDYDADGNQTKVKTATGIWKVNYNAQNRAIRFENADSHTIITCAYDYMGRRIRKKVEQNGETTLHERYIYRNYLQIAALDLLTNTTKHTILWDPTQPIATRPLSIQQTGTWYTYGWDLTKNITELYNNTGYILNLYSYTPYGLVTPNSEVEQPIQWSSEMHDAELCLVYYNYRYYNPVDGRWTRREPIGIEAGVNLYSYIRNDSSVLFDYIGAFGTTLDGLIPYEIEIASEEAIRNAINAVMALAAAQAAYARKKCKKCNPCIPEEGTLMYVLHAKGHTHFCKATKSCAEKGHTHFYIVQQTAYPACRCFAKRFDQFSVPGNHGVGLSYVEPAGGGPAL